MSNIDSSLALLTIDSDSLILTFFPVGTLGPLKQKVEDLFNHPKDAGPVRRVLVFGILFELCIEFSEERSDVAVAQRYSVLARMFLSKLEHAITELPLIIKPSVEAVTALIIAVSSCSKLIFISEYTDILQGSSGNRPMQALPGLICHFFSCRHGHLAGL